VETLNVDVMSNNEDLLSGSEIDFEAFACNHV
jgi:hypothetical protein